MKRAKDLLLIRNVDSVIDFANKFAGKPERMKRLVEKLEVPDHITKRAADLSPITTWFANRMRHAWHPEANSYVYAYAYCGRKDVEEDSEEARRYVEAMLESSRGRKDDCIDSVSLVKIGTSVNPESRRTSHLSELYSQFPKLKNSLELQGRLLILPCLRGNAGEYLESTILSCMPEEDNFSGEWYHDSVGVWRRLAGWFAAARALYLKRENRINGLVRSL